MYRLYTIIALLVLGIGTCMADDPVLQNGIWAGSIKLPGKDKTRARIRVSNETNKDAHAKTRITMYVDETPLDFIDLNIRKNTMEFTIDTGTVKHCTLKKAEGGAYSGFCDEADSKDEHARIELSMRPPKETDIGPVNPPTKETNGKNE
jgi:hypothetical protein